MLVVPWTVIEFNVVFGALRLQGNFPSHRFIRSLPSDADRLLPGFAISVVQR